MPPDLKARVKAAAAKNNRSLNAEICNALEIAYPENPFDLGEFISFLSKALNDADGADEISELVSDANAELEANDVGWRVESLAEDGGISVRIVSVADLFG